MTVANSINNGSPVAVVESHGVSPWELEVVHSYLNSRFDVSQKPIPDEDADPDVVSTLTLGFPFAFTEQFFEWFDYRRWEKLKGLFREMKRRRGSKKALRVTVSFAGNPSIRFVADSADRQIFDNSIEKIDFVLELLPYHLDPANRPEGTAEVTYRFNGKVRKWKIEGGRPAADAGEAEKDGASETGAT